MSEIGDPIATARRLMRPDLPKRFYKSAEAIELDGAFGVALDGRPVKTPGRNSLLVPSRPLAEALAAEWESQHETIDPIRMPLTRIVNSAIDGVAREIEAVRAEIVKYAGSDLICYRADGPERLVARQSAAWDPVLAWVRDAVGARFVLAEGIVFVNQPSTALDAVHREIAGLGPIQIAALSVVTTLTGSALLALALQRGLLSVEEVWTAAHIDEDWNVELWGEDEEAAERRARRYLEIKAAARIIELAA